MKKSITFFLDSNGSAIQKVREKISKFFKLHGLSSKTVHEQVMIIKELLKACTQYSGFNSQQDKRKIQIHINRNKITVEVSNQINDNQNKQIQELDKTIQFIRGYQDPFEAFLKLKATSNNGSDGLVLAKLSYEGKATLDFFVSEDNVMSMSAVRMIDCQPGNENL
jgi:hypothetical protein